MKFDPGFEIKPVIQPFGFEYGKNTFGPRVEIREIKDIRKSLLDPFYDGPEQVYAIAMDVGKKEHRQKLVNMHLLYGAVTYSAGRLGREPVRSQGHIHKQSNHAKGWSTPEVYEIWSGKAVIYMQESAKSDPGRCYAVYAEPGDVVIVPPGWAHATISADPEFPLTFGAWCDRNYGFDYDDVRSHGGLAWFPLLNMENDIEWIPNNSYVRREIISKSPGKYDEFQIVQNKPIYSQFEEENEKFLFVPRPDLFTDKWECFEP